MKKQFKKLKIIFASIVVLLIAVKAYAELIMSLAITASVLLHLIVAGVVWWTSARNGQSSVNTQSGNLKTPAVVTWWEKGADGNWSVETKNINVRVNSSDLRNGVNSNPSRYPRLKEAMEKREGYHDQDMSRDPVAAGTKYYNSYLNKTFTLTAGSQVSGAQPLDACTGINCNPGYNIDDANAISGSTNVLLHLKLRIPNWYVSAFNETYSGYVIVTGAATTETGDTRTLVPKTPEELAQLINGNPDYYGGPGMEIDDFIKSNPNIVHLDDPSLPGGDRMALGGQGTYQYPTAPTPQEIVVGGGGGGGGGGGTGIGTGIEPGTGIQEQISSVGGGATVPHFNPNFSTSDLDASKPEKKDIRNLWQNFIASSPLFGVITNTRVNLSGEVSTLSLYTGIGQNYKTIDFSHYQTPLDAAGTIMLAIAHIMGVWILFRD